MADKTLYPNTFQHHNAYVDQVSFYLTGNEEKVLNHIIREIIGYDDKSITRKAYIAMSILIEGKFRKENGERLSWGCGLKEGAVRNAINKLCEFGLISRVGKATQDGQCYELQLEWNKINWQAMQERKAENDAAYRKQLEGAREKNPRVENPRMPIKPQSVEQGGSESVEQGTKNPLLNPSLNPSVACQKQQATCPPAPSDLEQEERAQKAGLPEGEVVQQDYPPVAISADCQDSIATLFDDQPAPAAPAAPPKPAGPNKNAIRAQLEAHFCAKTKLPPPRNKTAREKKTAGALWWGPLREIAELCEWDAARAEKLICLTVDHLRSGKMTIANPNSILKTATAIYTGNVPGVKMPHEKKLQKITLIHSDGTLEEVEEYV